MTKLLLASVVVIVVTASAIPDPATQWSADCLQTTEGNFPGIRNGTDMFTQFYDYPNRDRLSYPTGVEQVFRFDEVSDDYSPEYQYGKAYQWTGDVSNPSKCCYIKLENCAPDQPPPCPPKQMVPIQVGRGSKDLGPERGGEHWHSNQNLVIFKVIEDYLIDPAYNNSVIEWNKTVSIQGESVFLTSTFTNRNVGGLIDADWAYPSNCPKMCNTRTEMAQLALSGYF